jgi:N-acyl-L-homoserine lactone synthetase
MNMSPRYYATIFEGWQFPAAVEAQQGFRKRLFVDELGWMLQHRDGIERDEFDTDSAVYCSLFLNREIVGCWRAIRGNEDYLGRKHFPQLAVLRPYPTDPDFWEITRLGALERPDHLLAVRYVYALLFYFARTRRATAVGGVMTPAHHRFAVMLGIRGRDYCEPQIVGRDARGQPIEVLFGEARMADQFGPRFEALCASVNELELKDEALVLGRRSIPA